MARESYRLANGGPVAGGGRDIMIRSGTYYDCLAQTLADDCRSEGDRDRGTLTRRFAQEVRCRNCRATQGGFEARSILIVFDNMNASSNEIKTFVEQLFLQSSHTLSKGKVIFCSTEQPFWYSPVEEARGHVKAFELLGLTFEDVEREFGVAVPKMQLKAVHNATGGHPMAIRLLVVRI